VRQQLGGQGFGLAEPFVGDQPLRPGRRLAQRLGIGRGPGQAVGGMLLGVEGGAVQPTVGAHPLGHGVLQLGHQHLGLAAGAVEQFGQVGKDEAHAATIGEACFASRQTVLLRG